MDHNNHLFHGGEEEDEEEDEGEGDNEVMEEEDEAAYVDSFFLPGGILDPEDDEENNDDDQRNDVAVDRLGTPSTLFNYRIPPSPWISVEYYVSREDSAPAVAVAPPQWNHFSSPMIAIPNQSDFSMALSDTIIPDTSPSLNLNSLLNNNYSRHIVAPMDQIPAPPGFDSTITTSTAVVPPLPLQAPITAHAMDHQPYSFLSLDEVVANHQTVSSINETDAHHVCSMNKSSTNQRQSKAAHAANVLWNGSAEDLAQDKTEAQSALAPPTPERIKNDEVVDCTASLVVMESISKKNIATKTMAVKDLDIETERVNASNLSLQTTRTTKTIGVFSNTNHDDQQHSWNHHTTLKRRARARASVTPTDPQHATPAAAAPRRRNRSNEKAVISSKQQQQQATREQEKANEQHTLSLRDKRKPRQDTPSEQTSNTKSEDAGKNTCTEMSSESSSRAATIPNHTDTGISIIESTLLIDCWVSWSLSVFRLVMQSCRFLGNIRLALTTRISHLFRIIRTCHTMIAQKYVSVVVEVCLGMCKYAIVGGWRQSCNVGLYGVVLFLPQICDVMIAIGRLAHYIPHLLSCCMLLYVTRPRAPTIKKKDMASSTSNVLLQCFRASLLGSLIMEGFLYENIWCMRWNTSERILLGFLLSVLRDGLIFSPIVWLSWALQVLLLSLFLNMGYPLNLFHNAVVLLLAFASLRYSLSLKTRDLAREKKRTSR